MNDALPYVEATHRMYGRHLRPGDPDPGENLPSWMILDQLCRDRYLFAETTRRTTLPTQVAGVGVVVKADSIAELAEKSGWIRPRNSLYRWTALEVSAASDPVESDQPARPTAARPKTSSTLRNAGRREYRPNTGQGHIDGSHRRRGAHAKPLAAANQSLAS